jgi:hypothetical protein
MKRFVVTAAIALIFFIELAGFTSHHGGAQAAFPLKIGVEPSLQEVVAFAGDGHLHVTYELTVSNLNLAAVRIDSLQVVGTRHDHNMFSRNYAGDALHEIFSSIAGNYGVPQDPLLPPGGSAFLFLFLDFQGPASVPERLAATLTVEVDGVGATSQTILSEPVEVSRSEPIEISPPLRGAGWWTPNGPSNFSIHRRVTVTVDGQIWRPERFAVDWVRLGSNGATFDGDPLANASYFAYGAKLVAVSDARVVGILDGIPDNVPNQPPVIELEPGTLPGNYVILQLDRDHFALYAHLIPGSLRVCVGDRVRRGEVLGLLGNSGGSTQPHLHFQVMDRPYPLIANGLPFLLDRFQRVDYHIDCASNENCDPTDGPTRLIVGRSHLVTDETFMNDDLGDFTQR